MIEIPLRPTNDAEKYASMSKVAKDIIVYATLMGVANNKAFLLFNPSYGIQVGGADRHGFVKYRLNKSGETENSHFWSYGKHKEFREDYEKTLEAFLNRDKVRQRAVVAEEGEKGESGGTRKERAMRNLAEQAMDLVEGQNLDADTLKVVTDIFNKLGYIKGEEVQIEQPRRYLPARCYSECQYRLFCEQGVANGEIENECDYCRALAYATEHGYKYDATTNLDIPREE